MSEITEKDMKKKIKDKISKIDKDEIDVPEGLMYSSFDSILPSDKKETETKPETDETEVKRKDDEVIGKSQIEVVEETGSEIEAQVIGVEEKESIVEAEREIEDTPVEMDTVEISVSEDTPSEGEKILDSVEKEIVETKDVEKIRLPEFVEEKKVEEEKIEKEAIESIEKAKEKKSVLTGKKEKKAKKKDKKKKKKKVKPIFEPYNPEEHGELIEYSPPPGWEIIDEYWIKEHYSKVFIIHNEQHHDERYVVVEPKLNPFEIEVYYELKAILKDELENIEIEEGQLKETVLKEQVDMLIKDIGISLTPQSYYKILYYLIRDIVHYERITTLMEDKLLEDISCNGYNIPIFVFHRNYTNLETNLVFDDPSELDAFVISLAQRCGKHISIADPMIDATMPNGSRIQMTLGREVTDHGSTFTIRKFREEPVTPVDLVAWKTFSAEEMAYLWLCIENKKSLIFAGGTASGKTTSMNAISLFIPRRAKIVTIEDTREIMLPHENWIPAVTRDAFHGDKSSIDMYDLLKAALRQRPEFIIVGEVRGIEALTLFQAMSTGHTTYSTLHADTISGVIHRLENPPISVPRAMIEALDIISIQAQTFVGKKRVRRNMEISEIVGLDPYSKMLRTTTVFQWDPVRDVHKVIGASKTLEDIRKSRGWTVKQLQKELERRKQIIEFMVEHNIRDFKSVANIIHAYQSNPERILEKMEIRIT